MENGEASGGAGVEDEDGGRGVVNSTTAQHHHHLHHHAADATSSLTGTHLLKDFPTRKRESMMLYHNVVLDNIIDSEGAFVNDMRALISTVLIPLRLRCGASLLGGVADGGVEAVTSDGGGSPLSAAEGETPEKAASSEAKEDPVCSSLPNNIAAGRCCATTITSFVLTHVFY